VQLKTTSSEQSAEQLGAPSTLEAGGIRTTLGSWRLAPGLQRARGSQPLRQALL